MNHTRAQAVAPLTRVVRPFQEFLQWEAAGGIILIVCIIIALLWANSPWAATYFHLWHGKFALGFAGRSLEEPLHFWINDGLMALFFLLVGLEIKRELLVGELASFRKASLPVAGALGGMVVPALIYYLLNRSGAAVHGWGIPMATDIAFALGVLTLLGKRVPGSLRIFLAALAIADDLGAVLVIALFYTETISVICLAAAAIIFLSLIALNRAGAHHPMTYALLGVLLWLVMLKSGVHATVAGVLLAITIPARQRSGGKEFVGRSERILAEIRRAEEEGKGVSAIARKSAALHALAQDCTVAESPMLRFEHHLAPWVSYFIMPTFALANAGVVLHEEARQALTSPIGLGVIAGLVLGKPLGITLFSWLTTRFGLASKPGAVTWAQILGVAALGGIGFTMSIFIAQLAFGASPALDAAKVAILAASLLAGIAGTAVLWYNSR